jgi:hypothetical protein
MKYDPLETAWRLRILRTYVGHGDSQTRFAEDYGFTVARWNNLERGHPLPRDVAIQLVRRIPGLSLDWLFFGKPDYLSVIMRSELEEVEHRVEPARPPKRGVKGLGSAEPMPIGPNSAPLNQRQEAKDEQEPTLYRVRAIDC